MKFELCRQSERGQRSMFVAPNVGAVFNTLAYRWEIEIADLAALLKFGESTKLQLKIVAASEKHDNIAGVIEILDEEDGS